jgi:ABC-type glycerol-3-phosphate transport system substrate-binding protein
VATPFVRGAYAAGKLSVGFWDHWVPGANVPLEKLCHEWADKEKVDIKVDFITSNGDKDLLTAAAEAAGRVPVTIFSAFLPGTRRAMSRPSNRSTTSWRC